MICAKKNYETVSKFVKVMPRILWPLFSGHSVPVWICLVYNDRPISVTTYLVCSTLRLELELYIQTKKVASTIHKINYRLYSNSANVSQSCAKFCSHLQKRS